MKLLGLFLLITASLSANAQFDRVAKNPVALTRIVLKEDAGTVKPKTSWWGFVIKADRQTHNRLRIPLLMMKGQSNIFMGESYWAGTITTQSYNRGKLGTFYYWDVQGNLRESKFFLDIAGKNKRGLKLVIPRR
jgi:hypothetical protein